MTSHPWLDVCLTVLVVTAVGCSPHEESRTTTDSSATIRIEDEERLRYRRSAEKRLGAWGARIDSLREVVGHKKAEAALEMKQEIEVLEEKRREASRRLEELKVAGTSQWNQARRQVADVLDSLDRRFDSLRSRLHDRS